MVASAGKPVVLVVMAGGAVCLGSYKSDPRVSAILFVGYPGQSGGEGVSDVIFGLYNPSGRLTQTFYEQPFLDEVSFLDMNMRPSVGNPGRGYRFYKGNNVSYPFGSGLSYTTFSYEWGEVLKSGNSQDLKVKLVVKVTNSGYKYAGAETLLMFLQPPDTSPSNSPMKILRNFEKQFLLPQDAESVEFDLTSSDFSLADENGKFAVIPGNWTVTVGSLSTVITI